MLIRNFKEPANTSTQLYFFKLCNWTETVLKLDYESSWKMLISSIYSQPELIFGVLKNTLDL